MNSPALKIGNVNSFDSFALSVQSLVGMLRTLKSHSGIELIALSYVGAHELPHRSAVK